jgi:hypothetical protein
MYPVATGLLSMRAIEPHLHYGLYAIHGFWRLVVCPGGCSLAIWIYAQFYWCREKAQACESCIGSRILINYNINQCVRRKRRAIFVG